MLQRRSHAFCAIQQIHLCCIWCSQRICCACGRTQAAAGIVGRIACIATDYSLLYCCIAAQAPLYSTDQSGRHRYFGIIVDSYLKDKTLKVLHCCQAEAPGIWLTSSLHTVHIRRMFPHILMDIPVSPCIFLHTRCILVSTHLHTLAYSRIFAAYCILAYSRVFLRICRVFSRVLLHICCVFTAYSCVLAAYSRVSPRICVRRRLYQSFVEVPVEVTRDVNQRTRTNR